ncbi:MAG: flagellar hook-length control protein FliK [Magnetococcales bacterium]|nr:flagellar hook-length control protein FliK [Magnetococcales bacterium]MBF0148538.1 flagellar hook-length control protein FliK [Magnetococcales bacterium]
MTIECHSGTFIPFPPVFDETAMIPLSMPLPEVQLTKPADVASNPSANPTPPPEEDFKEVLDRAVNPKKTDPVTSKDAQNTPGAEQDVATQQSATPMEKGQKNEATQKTEASAKEKSGKTAAEEVEQTTKRHEDEDEQKDEAVIAPWMMILPDQPVVTTMHPQLTLEQNPLSLEHPSMEQGMMSGGGTGMGMGMGGASKGGWIPPNPIEMALTGFKPAQASTGRAGQELFSLMTETGLNGQRVSGTGQVIQHAAKATMPAYSASFGEDLAEQIGRIRLISRPGMSEQVRINLVPRELGTLDVRLSVDEENRIHLLITADSDAARDLLNKQLPQLKEAFARQNFGLGEIAVQVDQRQKGDASGQEFEWRGGGGGLFQGDTEHNDSEPRPISEMRRPWTPGQGLSVFA